MTFCSTVKSIGGNTTFFDRREIYRIVGPLVLSAGVLLLFLTEGLKMNFKLSEGHTKPKFYIIQTSNKKRKRKRHTESENIWTEDSTVNGDLTGKKRKLFQLSADMKCISIEDMDIDIQEPNKSKCDIKEPLRETGLTYLNSPELLNSPNGKNINLRLQWMPVTNESDRSVNTNYNVDLNRETSNNRSPKRKGNAGKRFHWTKLSQESTGSEFSAINENEAMGSSGDSSAFKRHQRGPPVSPSGTFENPLARQWSTSSRASTTSRYSSYSDDAPLIKR